MNIVDKLKELGYSTIPENFYGKVAEWKSWYVGDVDKFHSYRRYNGRKWCKCHRASLGMGKKVCEDWANLLMNEKVQITLEGEREQAFVDSVFTANNFAVKCNEMQEMKAALGTAAYLPRVTGMEVSSDGETYPGEKTSVMIDYATIEHIYPLAWANGYISECAFTNVVFARGKKYLYLQVHKRTEDGLYDIENRIFRYDNDTIGEELALAEVQGYEKIPPVVHTGSDKRQFVIDRMNIANNYDYSLPVGASVYANAIDVLRGVDKVYDAYVNEYDLGRLRIMAQVAAMNYIDGEPTIDDNDSVFYILPEDVKDGAVITPISPPLRAGELNTGLQDQLNLLSSKCGFGETYYRFDGGNVATATQVISENSSMFRTIKKHEIILEQVLTELCRLILRLGNMAMNAGLNEDVAISIDFDDSIIEDKATDFARDMQLLNAGIMNDWEFRAKWMNESTEEAKKALPRMEDLVTENQEEIE